MNFTEKQKQNGFWVWDKTIEFPPDDISYPDEYKGQERINIFCTQLNNITTTEQKKLIRQWVDFFPTLKNVKFIWFPCHVTQELFDGVCNIDSLEGLSIKWGNIKTLDNISKLSNLKYLKIGSSAKIKSIEPLTSLTNLEVLDTENLKQISDFSALQNITSLKFLAVEGGMYTKQQVDNFDFLNTLTNLVFLRFAAIKSDNKDIKPIFNLKNLETFHWPFDIKAADIELLKSSLTKLKRYPGNYGFDNEKYLKTLFGQK